MTVVKEERKNRVFRFTDTEVSLIDELIDIENDKRMTIAREKNLKYKALNRTSFILYMAEERRRKYEEQGEF
ncbi:TPA: hypothetical protein ACR3Z0_006082 [Bacillus thuringiensis]|uniref:Uncharacterized protein n=1 Tax=Xenorhabdus santafensis TaxID=2582833 RepID=A0ABU4SFY4_9GAMM|nr:MULTISPECIES: hypothetical protein [Bacteria]MBD2807179.1 hypothetical protein [Xenorhabdus sp. ZM]MCU4918641.1 hypothetical protein [Bacillus cereus]AJA23891.1 hypothetical protein BT4G5_34400 [Bacillus thuringiensis serovar galleriae]ETE91559.1 hypothetical protein C623_0227360 [Bacillus thuringiensis serovar aizawai str. Hu4-2]MCC3901380.1 hypothetical protein [Bacillus thuringiensis]